MVMKNVFFALSLLVLGHSSAFAAPECAVIVDGEISAQNECHPFAPLDSESYKAGIRCYRAGGLLVTVDYTIDHETDNSNASVQFDYIDKEDGWYISNRTAVEYELVTNQPVLQVSPDMANIVPAKYDTYGWLKKDVKVQFNLKE